MPRSSKHPEQILIHISPELTLDYGTITDRQGIHATIHPPDTRLLDQIVNYLNTKPDPLRPTPKRLGQGLAALCIRWGSYLATLIDSNSPPHPDLTDRQPGGMIDDWEMRRLNIEMSCNLAWVMKQLAKGNAAATNQLLIKAGYFLPMPYALFDTSKRYTPDLIRFATDKTPPSLGFIPRLDLDSTVLLRACANTIIKQTWRNGTSIEEIHAHFGPLGWSKQAPLSPHERRLTRDSENKVMEVMISHMIASYRALPAVVQHASLDSVLILQTPYNWSFTDTTYEVKL
jgi:hypothetical protein